jgi:SH3 domain-containing kinase-binding protein 1
VNGVTGLFPSNFIEFREAKPEPVLPDVPKMREVTEASRSRRAKVAFSYLAENTDELTLPVGEIVEVIDEEEEGWWRGKLNGKEGVFPSNFVEVIKEEPEPPPPTYNNLPPQTAMPPNRPPGGRPPSGVPMPGFGGINPSELKQKLKPVSAAPPAPSHGNEPQPVKTNPGLPPPKMEQLQKAKVMFKYDADQDDEITVKEGDIVDVLKMETDQEGWVLIRLNNKQGMVPENFISIMKQQPPPQAERDIKPPEDNVNIICLSKHNSPVTILALEIPG